VEGSHQVLGTEVGACFDLARQPEVLRHIELREEFLLKLHYLLAVDARQKSELLPWLASDVTYELF
jgi:hypothetical protein